MVRQVFIIERSHLAKNVYSMILSNLDDVEIVSGQVEDFFAALKDVKMRPDLLIVSQSTLKDRKKEFFERFAEASKIKAVPCVIFVHQGFKSSWKEFSGFKKVKIMERPFSPDDFLEVVKGFWRVR